MDRKNRAVFFGELLMRLATKRHERIVQARELDVGYTGAETNAAVSLSHFGIECDIVSAVPDNEIGQACINFLRQFGLHTDYIKRCGERLGTNYFEIGASQRASKVIYDRRHSAIHELRVGDLPWDEIFADQAWFHFSGTAPALSDDIADIVSEACQAAQGNGVTVSCDLNYRRKLWSPDKANQVMVPLMQHIDVLIGNEEDAEIVFGIKAEGVDVGSGCLNAESYKAVARQLHDRFGLRYVATTLRESLSASHNNWSGLLFDGKDAYLSKKHAIHQIVDRIGAGDAFSGGLIYGLLQRVDLQQVVEFATAASCLKHTIHGDFNLMSKDEVMALVQGDASGRVKR